MSYVVLCVDVGGGGGDPRARHAWDCSALTALMIGRIHSYILHGAFINRGRPTPSWHRHQTVTGYSPGRKPSRSHQLPDKGSAVGTGGWEEERSQLEEGVWEAGWETLKIRHCYCRNGCGYELNIAANPVKQEMSYVAPLYVHMWREEVSLQWFPRGNWAAKRPR